MLLDLLERFGLENSCEDAISVEENTDPKVFVTIVSLVQGGPSVSMQTKCIHAATLARDRVVGAATTVAMSYWGLAINRRRLK